MVGDHFGMHSARIFLSLLLLLLMYVFVVGAIGINRSHLCAGCDCEQRNCARDKSYDFVSHFAWL